MGKKLILTEKPSVAKELAALLGANVKQKTYFEGPNYIITWAYGHLLSLKMPEEIKPEWKTWALETLPMIPKKWENRPLPKTGGQLKAIAQLGKRSDVVGGIIATDSGREGELVAREIFQWISFKKPLERLWISSQTKKAVLAGFKNLKPASHYEALYQSACARSQADWLVGLNVTRALTVKYGDNLSAGRVQTPTLAAVFQTEEKIKKFIPQTYYEILLNYEGLTGKLQAKNPQQFKTREEAEVFLDKLKGKIGKITTVSKKEKREKPPLPYDLTEIQRVANQRYQFSAKKTLSLMQSLYETHKIVSYPRTDSKYLPLDLKGTMKERLKALGNFQEEVRSYLKDGGKVLQTAVFNDSKVTDHYGLIPTEEMPQIHKLTSDELKMYRLVVTRFLGLFAKDYVEEKTTATFTFPEGSEFLISTTQVLEKGFKDEMEKAPLVNLAVGKTVKDAFSVEKKLTQPPKLMTEGQLLGFMEKNSLGTPATRAEIIEKLLKTELMVRNPGTSALSVTPKGQQLLKLVNPSLVTPELTGKWEQQLEKISQNKLPLGKFIAEVTEDTKGLVAEIKESKENYQDFSLTTKKCPECGEALKEKNTRDGKIYVCSNPECHYKRRKDPKVSNHRCPTCHKKMEILDGKNGAYFRCKFCGTTEKIPDKKSGGKKMNAHEAKRLMKKVNQEAEPLESPLAQALKAAMNKE